MTVFTGMTPLSSQASSSAFSTCVATTASAARAPAIRANSTVALVVAAAVPFLLEHQVQPQPLPAGHHGRLGRLRHGLEIEGGQGA